MANSSKEMAEVDANQAIKFAFDSTTKTIAMGNFLTAKAGHKITQTAFSASVDDYTYSDSGTTLLVLRISYTDATKATFLSAERIS